MGPSANVRAQVLVPEKWIWKEDTGGGDELAAENIAEGQKRQDTERGDQKGVGTRDYIDRQNQEKKADEVSARNEDGG